MNDMDLVREFLTESAENLDRLDQDFVALEKDPTAKERVASIFRTIHTIKGTCGFMGFVKLESVAHVGENLLSRIRDGQLVMNSEMTTWLLKLVDAVREMLHSIETTGTEGTADYSEVIATLVRLNEQASPHELASPAPGPRAISAEPGEAVDNNAAAVPDAVMAERTPEMVAAATNAIRVDVTLLDKLMTLVGELVLARNQVLQYTSTQKDAGLLRTAQRLNLITTELQEGVMKTRMQPIGNLWSKFPRVIRDISMTCHKKIRLEMEGRETELDKTIIEAIKDPLTHVIRNSVDHGIEAPEKRIARGKPEEGRLFMRAYHEGGQVNIEISDDGAGINPEIVKRKALERGLITPDQSARMTDRDAIALIFLPGFSTAEKVTNVSGRGVGMDVVKTNVEKIGGTVDVTSEVGKGTTLRIKIPLTLAIIPALVVSSGGERFAIPQVNLLELVRIEGDEPGIEVISGTSLYRLRGDLLPLVYLNGQLKLSKPADNAAKTDEATNIVVLRSGDRNFGLVVDQINDTEEIVVKPLAKQLKGISVFAGATIMGDGRVALILDVPGLAHGARAVPQNSTPSSGKEVKADEAASNRQTMLVFKVDGEQRMAIPLSMVTRLEEFRHDAIEEAGGQPVVQYRGEIMPLLNLAEMLRDRRGTLRMRRYRKETPSAEMVQVIVYTQNNRNFGLRVERILDVVDEHLHVQTTAARPGVLGTAVLREKIVGLLDVDTIVRAATETFTPRPATLSRAA